MTIKLDATEGRLTANDLDQIQRCLEAGKLNLVAPSEIAALMALARKALRDAAK